MNLLKMTVRRLLSKKIISKRVVFESNGHYDNGYALFSFARVCRPDLDVFFLSPDGIYNRAQKMITDCREKRGIFFRMISRIKAFRLISSCETFFGSFTIQKVNPKTRAVYVSHGFSLKKAGDYYNSIYSSGCDILYPSQALAQQYKTQFEFNDNRIVLCGQPRSDKCVFSERNSALFNGLVGKKEGEKVVLALTTFRRHSDGSFDFSDVFPKSIDFYALNEFLEIHNLRFVFKLHHVLDNADISQISGLSKIVCLKNADLFANDLELISILPYADAFISDYSGAASDSFMCDKPVGFLCDDLEAFASGTNEGFTFEDPLSMMPGDHIKTQADLESFLLDVVLGEDRHASWRHQVAMIMNGFIKPPLNCCKTLLNIYYPERDSK